MAICSMSKMAIGADVPRDLQAALKPFPTLSVAIEGQVLRVVMNEAGVNRATLEAIAAAYCRAGITSVNRRPWGGLALRGVEVVNVTQAQGFAFSGTVVDCVQWSKLPTEAVQPFLEKRTSASGAATKNPR